MNSWYMYYNDSKWKTVGYIFFAEIYYYKPAKPSLHLDCSVRGRRCLGVGERHLLAVRKVHLDDFVVRVVHRLEVKFNIVRVVNLTSHNAQFFEVLGAKSTRLAERPAPKSHL